MQSVFLIFAICQVYPMKLDANALFLHTAKEEHQFVLKRKIRFMLASSCTSGKIHKLVVIFVRTEL